MTFFAIKDEKSRVFEAFGSDEFGELGMRALEEGKWRMGGR